MQQLIVHPAAQHAHAAPPRPIPQAVALQQAGPEAKQRILEFRFAVTQRVLVTSYETLRKVGPQLAGVFQLLVCDEGHR